MQFFTKYKKQIFASAAFLLLSLNIIVWQSIFNFDKKADLEVNFIDVGQGDAIFIESKDGTQILIDGGPNSQILSKLSSLMEYYDREIDVVVATHPHADHITGLIDVLTNYRVGEVVESGVFYNTAEFATLEKILKEKNIKKVIINRSRAMSFYDGAKMKFLHPDGSFEGAVLKNAHDAALVSVLEYGGKKILLMSDAEKKLEESLNKNNKITDIDVLKTGHHGSKTSSNGFFLKTIKPEYAIISAGARNRYGHPHQDVLSRLAVAGAKIFRTDLDGTIKLEIRDGKMFWTAEKCAIACR